MGAFTTEYEANRLLDVAPERYPWAVDFLLNIITVHRTYEDWESDR